MPVRLVFVLVLLALSASAGADFHGEAGNYNVPRPLEERIGFDQHPGARVPGDPVLRGEDGRPVRWSQLFHGRPLVLGLVYYRCPNLCSLSIGGLFQAMTDLRLTAGRDYDVALVSIDPRETPQLARAKREHYLRAYRRLASPEGIRFLTADASATGAIAKAIGFRYFYDPEHDQYVHPSGLVTLTPEGRVSRYLFGVEYPDQGLRLAVLEASQRRIASVVDHFLLFCYGYDPATGRYTFLVRRALSWAAAGTVLLVATVIGSMLYRERKGRPA